MATEEEIRTALSYRFLIVFTVEGGDTNGLAPGKGLGQLGVCHAGCIS